MRRLLFCVMLLALPSGLCKAQTAGVHKQQTDRSQGAGASNPSAYVGADTCAICHADVAKSFASNPHYRLALTNGGKGITCEGCHGPGKAHVDSGGDVTKIFRFSQAPAKQIDATCLSCHAGVHPDFARSPHAKAGLSCTSCHSNHSFKMEDNLLKTSQPTLCYSCHTDVKPAFSQPFRHRVDEGLIKCTDCHDPHGTFQSTQLRSTADQNAICTKCHMEKAGPFAYEHPVVKTEGCTSCHTPHGSPNPRLLSVGNVNTLCLQCHSETNMSEFPHSVSPSGPTHNQAAQYVSCTTCHTQIHGSNASDIFFK